jgi:hypothetical protein
MSKFILVFLGALACLQASVMTASVTCGADLNSAITITGTDFAECDNDTRYAGVFGGANVYDYLHTGESTGGSFPFFAAVVNGELNGYLTTDGPYTGVFEGTAAISALINVDVTDPSLGPSGYLTPIFHYGGLASAQGLVGAVFSFDGQNCYANGTRTDENPCSITIPYVLDVPQTIPISIFVSAYVTNSDPLGAASNSGGFYELQARGQNGGFDPNLGITEEIPEPSLVLVLGFLLAGGGLAKALRKNVNP